MISVSFHWDETSLNNSNTDPGFDLLSYLPSLQLTHHCLFIHSQNEAKIVHPWPKDRDHLAKEKSLLADSHS